MSTEPAVSPAPLDDPRVRSRMRRSLLAWFSRHARELPWRSHPTPYQVWVSEIMLQQTQVATVIAYYHRFLAAYPTIAALAAADEQDLMRLWEGLGYYRRARSLHAAAKRIVAEHDGVFPMTYSQTIALPGIGRYTAGAILSISGDQRLPVLEGNTLRVYSRWAGLRGDVTSSPAQRTLWSIAERMLPRRGAGQFNQAAMELGSLICRPQGPQCEACCVRPWCQAYALGLQESIPGKVKRLQYESRQEYGFVIPLVGSEAVLLRRVPAGQRWAGLWDFPRWTAGDARSAEHAAALLSRQLGTDLVLKSPQVPLASMKHVVTRFRISLQVHRTAAIDPAALEGSPETLRPVQPDDFADFPLNVTGRKIARLVAASLPDDRCGTA